MGDGTSGLALVGLFQTRPNLFSATSHWVGLARALSGCCFSCSVPRPFPCLAVSTFPTFHAETVPKGLGRSHQSFFVSSSSWMRRQEQIFRLCKAKKKTKKKEECALS
ncbi:hypothetical protein BO86DRAFT_45506 [Aspergillus japonicus CBS 114.51]|uniref:Uncharacterized protein n=1 Tax=Aspergillus japonicus CBS 114.51 TaxID=1448312 RepID=A0A8T8WJJ9_ASPJA|nr:hypothetical protein BO86DRAFT_45506 [Aspergillus japonicus CBS 114.51]RAH75884.1 hypothetical protein BO86DRAFT_45506 [Aspergillus japonicus CBS 114.51]